MGKRKEGELSDQLTAFSSSKTTLRTGYQNWGMYANHTTWRDKSQGLLNSDRQSGILPRPGLSNVPCTQAFEATWTVRTISSGCRGRPTGLAADIDCPGTLRFLQQDPCPTACRHYCILPIFFAGSDYSTQPNSTGVSQCTSGGTELPTTDLVGLSGPAPL